MCPEHSVIIIPGLGDRIGALQRATNHWQRSGLEPIVYPIGWRDGEGLVAKLERLNTLIEKLASSGNLVSEVGLSAGGGAALNTDSSGIHRRIMVCARLRTGTNNGFRSFRARTSTSPAFAESVRLAEKREKTLGASERQKIMTVRAMFGDELVPADTATIPRAYNITIPTIEHVVSIYAALTVFSKPLIEFLTSE